MTLLAFTIHAHTAIRLAEVGTALGAIGGVALLVGGGMRSDHRSGTRFGQRGGQVVSGLLLAIGFVLLIITIHWGNFGHPR